MNEDSSQGKVKVRYHRSQVNQDPGFISPEPFNISYLGLAGKYDSITLIFCWSRLISASSCFLFSFSSRSLFCSCTFWYFKWSTFCSSSLARFSFWMHRDANFLLFCCFFCKTCDHMEHFKMKSWISHKTQVNKLVILWQRLVGILPEFLLFLVSS